MTQRTDLPDVGLSTEIAYQHIRSQIVSGQLRSGEWLRENELAAQLAISRTPIREALGRLVADGLVLHEPNRGVRIARWTLDDLNQIYEVRLLLEPHGSYLAAQNPTTDISVLGGLANAMSEAATSTRPDVPRITELNNAFHSAILEFGGNDRLSSLVSSIVQVPMVRQTFARYEPDEMARSLAHHHEIVRALAARDGEWASSVMRSHLRAGWNAIRRTFEETNAPTC
ncbi:MAG: GntR family transcriptional regulator [Acidimicrobiales bacterium]